MIIGLDASRANNPQKSGVEWYSYHLIKDLYKIDSRNQYFLYTDKKLTEDLKPTNQNFQEKILRWPFNRFWTLGRMSLEVLWRQPDILFIPAHTFPLVGGRKNIITIHDIGFERYPETYTKWELTSLKEGIKRAKKIADRIIAVSKFTKEEIVRIYNIEPTRIKVIYLGCDHQRWYPVPQEVIQRYLPKLKISQPYFIFLGRLTLKKNIIGLIRIYNRFREKVNRPYNLILVGSDTPAFQNEINEEIKASFFRQEIKKVGRLPIKELPILLSGAEALVFPSIYEGFGLPVIEAMACGCPVIVSTSGALPEIVNEAGLLIDAHNVEGFASKMIDVISNQKLRQDLINKGLIHSQQFNWGKCARETLEVLESVGLY